jgi:hypothetical protein
MKTRSSGIEHLACVREADLLVEDKKLVARVKVDDEQLSRVLHGFLLGEGKLFEEKNDR